MNISSITTVRFPSCDNLNKELNSGSVDYANFEICILRNELYDDCNDMQLISSHSLTLLHMQFNAVYICTKSLSQKVRLALFCKLKIGILQDER